jgi:hypothetical protein
MSKDRRFTVMIDGEPELEKAFEKALNERLDKLEAKTKRYPVIDDNAPDCFVLGSASSKTAAMKLARMSGDAGMTVVDAVLSSPPTPSGEPEIQTEADIFALENCEAVWVIQWKVRGS